MLQNWTSGAQRAIAVAYGGASFTLAGSEQGTHHPWPYPLAGFGDSGFAGDVPALVRAAGAFGPSRRASF